MDTFWSLLSLLAFTASTVASVHLLLNYRRPATAMSWAFALWVLPLLGASLYAMFAVYQGPRRLRRRRTLSRRLRARRRDRAPSVDEEAATTYERVADAVNALPLVDGNAVELHADGPEARRAYLDLLASAEREILLMSFIWEGDAFSDEVACLLGEKRRAGCDVRVVVDAIGSRRWFERNFRNLVREGVPFERFLEPNPLKGRFQINFRNHRKMLVVDGDAAIVGGRNVSDPYYAVGPTSYRDLSVTLRGPVVEPLRSLFLEDWIVASDSPDDEPEHLDDVPEAGDVPLRVIPHGVDEPLDAYMPLLSVALQTAREDVTIVTPYFVPGESLLYELRVAALRGVRVRVLMPVRSPERWPEIAARRFFGPLFEVGVEIWRRPDPFLHAKAVLIDDSVAYFGSANFDQRSFYLNYELTCEARHPRVVEQLRAHFEPDFELAERMDPERFAERGWWTRAQENFVALFAPLL